MDDDLLNESLRLKPRFKDRESGRDYWYSKIKCELEVGAALEVLRTAGHSVEQLAAREKDPPDCEALVDGQRCGIEVTELVHQTALELSEQGGKENECHFVWERDDFEQELRKRIDRKDQPGGVKGGPYHRYFLVIVTDEMVLDRNTVERFLADLSFETRLITDILFGISYDPSIKRCPVLRVPVTPRA
jgi:hypothetical protein